MNVKGMTDKELADRARLLISSADPFIGELIHRDYSVDVSSPGTGKLYTRGVAEMVMVQGITLTIGKMETI